MGTKKQSPKPKRKRPPKYVYLNGHTCVSCGRGWYDGYENAGHVIERTRPCNVCGYMAPAKMTVETFEAVVKARDAILSSAQPSALLGRLMGHVLDENEECMICDARGEALRTPCPCVGATK